MEIFIGLFVLWIAWMIFNEIRKNKFVDFSLFESTEQAIRSGHFDEIIYKSHIEGLTNEEIADDMLQSLVHTLITKGKLHRATLKDSEFKSKYRMSLKINIDNIAKRILHIKAQRNPLTDKELNAFLRELGV